MTQEHPITPPPELVVQWLEESPEDNELGISGYIATQAARWGADQELNECCKWLPKLPPWSADDLRKHRRLKPPSPKEEALQVLEALIESRRIVDPEYQALRHALEQIND